MLKPMLSILTTLLLAPLAALCSAEVPLPKSPAAGTVTYSPHPHFRWQREENVKMDEVHRIQVARDEAFAEVVCDDRLEVVSRFVPVKPLPPSKYWWRVRRGNGDWSQAVAFEVRAPEKVFLIRAGSDAKTVARVLQEAGASGPARADFEPGEYALSVHDRTGLVTLEDAHDLIIDGHGAKLVLAGETCLLSLRACQRVTVQNFEARSSQTGHTLVRVLSVDQPNARLAVKPEPGYDPDVARFFVGEGNAGSFLNRVDPAHHGRHLSRGFVSARDAKAAPVPNADEQFYIGPVKAGALSHHEPGALAVVTMYRSPFVRMDGTDECTLSNIKLVDHPGGPCMGNDNSAQSLLAVKAVCRTPADYQGGHSGVNNGRIGAWVEACEYECLADDGGPAHQALRMKVDRADRPDSIILADSWTNSELRPADRIVIMDSLTGRFAITTLRTVSEGRKAMRLQLGDDLARLANELGRESSQSWKGVLVYRYAPSNEDFVYRHNRHVGGRGHGVKFNGTRGWIADNHFENVTGNPIHVGFTYTEAISGVGARDVVVSGNTIIYSGWTPITCLSTSRLGGNILIRDNHITEAREAAIAIQGCDGVTLRNNTFTSTAPPSRGAWIFATDAKNVSAAENKHSSDVPLLKTAP
jgi:parallel beta-helix repeat protein